MYIAIYIENTFYKYNVCVGLVVKLIFFWFCGRLIDPTRWWILFSFHRNKDKFKLPVTTTSNLLWVFLTLTYSSEYEYIQHKQISLITLHCLHLHLLHFVDRNHGSIYQLTLYRVLYIHAGFLNLWQIGGYRHHYKTNT